MLYQIAKRPVWTIREGDRLPGLGRIRSVSQLPETDAVCIVLARDGEAFVYNAEDRIDVLVGMEGNRHGA